MCESRLDHNVRTKTTRLCLSARAGWIGAAVLLLFSASSATDGSMTGKGMKEPSGMQTSPTVAARPRSDQVKADVSERSITSGEVGLAVAQEGRVVDVTGIEVRDRGSVRTTILVTAGGALTDYESFALPDPPRLVIDLPHARHAIAQPIFLPAGSPVLKIRTTQHRERPIPVVRLVFDLGDRKSVV